MARYSHSKLTTFENCPYQFKLKYIDKIKPDIPTSIEAFMGDMVHRSLELLYKKLQDTGWRLSMEEVVLHYDKLWQENWTDDILIVKKFMTQDKYRNMGRKFVRDYYVRYYPFNDLEIIGIETDDMMTLPDGSEWYVRIDLFAKDSEGNYYVIDHKTNNKMKEQWEADVDKQLASYALWVKKMFGQESKVKLVWNMLAHDERVVSEASEDRLNKLIEELMIKIARIENTSEFPARTSFLCNYCGYQNICPYFAKEKEEGNL